MSRSPSLFTIAMAMSMLIILFCASFNLSLVLNRSNEHAVVSPLVTPAPTRGFNPRNVYSLLYNGAPPAPSPVRRL